MEELQIVQKNGSIECNFADIKADLSNMMSAYTSLEITEDKIAESKKDLATLRKIRKAVDDKRKDVKKTFMQPYTDFENSVKDLLTVIDEPINMIDSKLKEFDEKRKEEKLTHIRELYDEHIGEYGDYLTFNSVFDNRWLNASTTDKDVIYDLSERITKVRSEIDAIKALHSEIEEECLRVYRNTGNSLTAAITKNSDYINAKELAKKKLEEDKKAEAEKKAVEEQIAAIPDEGFMNPPEFCESDHVMTFKVIGDENIQKVKEFLDFAEIEYSEV